MPKAVPIVLGENAGELLWFNGDLFTFKATSEQTNGAFILFEEWARRGKVTPLHLHPGEDESFHILEGEVLVQIDGEEHLGGPGSFISVPRGVPHALMVVSETARALTLLTPGGRGIEAFFRDAGDPAPRRELPPPAPLDLERIRAAAERHGALEILGPPPFAPRAQTSPAMTAS